MENYPHRAWSDRRLCWVRSRLAGCRSTPLETAKYRLSASGIHPSVHWSTTAMRSEQRRTRKCAQRGICAFCLLHGGSQGSAFAPADQCPHALMQIVEESLGKDFGEGHA